MSTKLKKIQIKVIDDISDDIKWEHLAYAEPAVYDEFLKTMGCSRKEFANYVSKWAFFDFNIKLTMAHRNDIETLRVLVKERYKKAYPDLYVESETDRQGWMRAWLTKHMKEEIKFYNRGN